MQTESGDKVFAYFGGANTYRCWSSLLRVTGILFYKLWKTVSQMAKWLRIALREKVDRSTTLTDRFKVYQYC